MLKAILPALALLAIAWSSPAATPAKPHKRRHTATAASSTPTTKRSTAATKATGAKATGAKGAKVEATKATSHRKGKPAAPRYARSYQQAPTRDRYKEIQEALASKGYYNGEPNGAWGADSEDALKRFQAEQNLMPDGKINSLSLIALGLGPKRLTAKSDSAPLPGTSAPPPPNPPQ